MKYNFIRKAKEKPFDKCALKFTGLKTMVSKMSFDQAVKNFECFLGDIGKKILCRYFKKTTNHQQRSKLKKKK